MDQVIGHRPVADEGGERTGEDQERENCQQRAKGHVSGHAKGIIAPQTQHRFVQNCARDPQAGAVKQVLGVLAKNTVGHHHFALLVVSRSAVHSHASLQSVR